MTPELRDQFQKLLAGWKGSDTHEAFLELGKEEIVHLIVDFLTGKLDRDQLWFLYVEAQARYKLLQAISLDGLPAEVFSSDTVDDLEARKKARIAEIEKFWRERAAQGSRTL